MLHDLSRGRGNFVGRRGLEAWSTQSKRRSWIFLLLEPDFGWSDDSVRGAALSEE